MQVLGPKPKARNVIGSRVDLFSGDHLEKKNKNKRKNVPVWVKLERIWVMFFTVVNGYNRKNKDKVFLHLNAIDRDRFGA